VRSLPARAGETNTPTDGAPISMATPTMFELTLPRRLPRGIRKRAIATLALVAATASMFVWRSSGAEVEEASASTSPQRQDAGPDGVLGPDSAGPPP
jgi:hypothetical protein